MSGATATPSVPSGTPGAAAPAGGTTTSCSAAHQSAVQVVDELGMPIAGVTVNVTIGGTSSTPSTDSSGTLCFSFPPGTSVQVALSPMHEAHAGDSTTTPSGHHFKAGGTGP
jgi:hypothetical protein